ncbi:MAG: lantibiotic dehydratase [Candidatus Omnitrophota bacterium]
MREKIPYQQFASFVLRSPTFPMNVIDGMLSEREIPEDKLLEFCRQPVVDEALFLASPDLHSQLHERLAGKLTDPKKVKKLHYALMRYILRMIARCTPFGLFAGFCVGNWGSETRMELSPIASYSRHTRLDMNYLCALAQDLARHPIIKQKINYYPNSSCYPVGDQLRYVEYRYKNAKRTHHIVAVDHTPYLQRVLQAASGGAQLNDLIDLLVDDEITREESAEYIAELIDSQVLVNELEPAITGPEFLDQILTVLEKINGIDPILSVIHTVKTDLCAIDSNPIGSTVDAYQQIAEAVKALNTGFELKYLFQTDMVKPFLHCTLDSTIAQDVLDGFVILNKLSPKSSTTMLTQFRDAFTERYETKEVPLLQVLDTEIGLGYRQSGLSGDVSPLVDDLALPPQGNQGQDIKWTAIQTLLAKKHRHALSNGLIEIELTDKDVEPFPANWDDLPDTLSSIIQLIDAGNGANPKPKIYMSGLGGSSAGNLLGRFCHADPCTDAYVKHITRKEEELNPDVILAEIIHLPESRIGNVLLRPVLRSYEIPYLARAAVPPEFQIKLDDLMVSVKGNRVVLRSKRLNKEIIPHLTNAHNYSYNALPVYHFLCDLQTQHIRGGLGFNWGTLANEYEFLPRVIYKNLILSPATWHIRKEEFEPLTKITDDEALYHAVREWREKRRIPVEVLLADSDNKLYIHLNNAMCIRTLFSVTQNRPGFELEEFLFNAQSAVVNSTDGVFTNEIALSFYRESKGERLLPKEQHPDIKRTFVAGDEWLYYKFYTGPRTADLLLTELVKPLLERLLSDERIDSWFFIRYADPKEHIRVRFHLPDARHLGAIMADVRNGLAPYIHEKLIWKVQLDTYEREVERYGFNSMALAETYFHHDSDMIVGMLALIGGDEGERIRWLFGLRAVDAMLDDFRMTMEEKLNLITGLRENFGNEFGLNRGLKEQLETKFRQDRPHINEVLDRATDEVSDMLPLFDLLTQKSIRVTPIVAQLLELNGSGTLQMPLRDLLASFSHMMINRLFKSRQRLHELVLYDFLHRYYKSELGKQKYQTINEQKKKKERLPDS